jgi:hypothetical protein
METKKDAETSDREFVSDVGGSMVVWISERMDL